MKEQPSPKIKSTIITALEQENPAVDEEEGDLWDRWKEKLGLTKK